VSNTEWTRYRCARFTYDLLNLSGLQRVEPHLLKRRAITPLAGDLLAEKHSTTVERPEVEMHPGGIDDATGE